MQTGQLFVDYMGSTKSDLIFVSSIPFASILALMKYISGDWWRVIDDVNIT